MQDRGLAAYIAELIGTLLLVFTIAMTLSLYLAPGQSSSFSSDFAVIGLVHGLVLFLLIQVLIGVSGAHLNPAVTLAAAAMKRIDPVDALVYVLAQLSGGVLGALLTKALLEDEGLAGDYGAASVSPLLANAFAGAVIEAIGAFLLVLAFIATAMSLRSWQQWGAITTGLTYAFVVMVFGPLTLAAVNPARWFGPALIGDAFNGFGGSWPYVIGPLVGALLAVAFYRAVIFDGEATPNPDKVAAT